MTDSAFDYRLRSLERRVREIEEVKPDVIAERVAQLTRRVDTLIKVGIGILIALVGSSITFAFTVFALIGNG